MVYLRKLYNRTDGAGSGDIFEFLLFSQLVHHNIMEKFHRHYVQLANFLDLNGDDFIIIMSHHKSFMCGFFEEVPSPT